MSSNYINNSQSSDFQSLYLCRNGRLKKIPNNKYHAIYFNKGDYLKLDQNITHPNLGIMWGKKSYTIGFGCTKSQRILKDYSAFIKKKMSNGVPLGYVCPDPKKPSEEIYRGFFKGNINNEGTLICQIGYDNIYLKKNGSPKGKIDILGTGCKDTRLAIKSWFGEEVVYDANKSAAELRNRPYTYKPFNTDGSWNKQSFSSHFMSGPDNTTLFGVSRKHRRSKHKSRPKKNRTQKRNKNKSSKRNIPKRKKNSKNLRRRRVNGKKSQRRK